MGLETSRAVRVPSTRLCGEQIVPTCGREDPIFLQSSAVKLALIQLNPTVGDLPANAEMIVDRARDAHGLGAGLVVFPELALVGYPPRDLLLQEGFLEDVREACESIARELAGGAGGPVVMLGTPWRCSPSSHEPADAFDPGGALTNSVLVMQDGTITHRYDKRLLPTYDIFDEHRYFTAGSKPLVLDIEGVRVGVAICEDLWQGFDAGNEQRYKDGPDPLAELIERGAELIVSPSASPFVLGKGRRQRELLAAHVCRHRVALASVNQVGANDDLIFDGHSAVFVPTEAGGARLVAAGNGFEEQTVLVEFPAEKTRWETLPEVRDPLIEADDMRLLESALVLGVRDYVRKTGFSRVCLGISGGIDSALTAALAVRAVGAENVTGVMMPSRYSSDGSISDARALAENLGMACATTPIESMHGVSERALEGLFAELGLGNPEGVTEENVQSRLRGLVMMALSNQSGALLLTTGNKSELAVGYCTLYGDMNGGLAVLSDITKVQVFRLSRWINAHYAQLGFDVPPIPVASIEKPPSAELRPDQVDQDSLPPYEVLDEIVERYVQEHQSLERIIDETGFDPALVGRIVRLVDVNEYKRKQLAIGLKVSSVAFGRGRRRAIAQAYRPDLKIPSA